MLSFDMKGAPLRMAPFDNKVTLWVGGKKLSPPTTTRDLTLSSRASERGLFTFPLRRKWEIVLGRGIDLEAHH